ncbi:MAG: UvrD-helicase domain-containing protein [Spirochaetales bacterium]|nr:UvrD-helicase domain-containing protein [Spirochaetales bacterium]
MAVDLKRELNPEQAAAADRIEGPSLIIAGAGSGKTRMITFRIAHMLDSGIDERNILALTFTNKAAKEMSERIRELTKLPLKGLTTTTFHSFGLGLLKQYIQYLGYKNNFTIYDTNDNTALLKQVIVSLGYHLGDYNTFTLLQTFSDLKTGRIREIENKQSALNEIYTEWLKSQKAYNVVDFDDLILLPIRLFEKRPDVLEKVQERFRYIMVDEFQDTSLLQYRFVSMIAQKYHNICVVGDDDQSIYSWRGANYRNIQMFETDFPERKEFKLERNYRSTGTILEAANNLITHNEERKQKKLWTEESKGSNIYLIRPVDGEDEAMIIAESIKRRAKETGLSYSDFGILVRTNSLLTTLENALLENGIQTQVSGGQSFFDRKEVRDLICYLKLIVNDEDDVSLLRIINTPRRGIGRVSIEKLREYADRKHICLFDAISQFAYAADSPVKGKSQEALRNFTSLILSWQSELENNRKAHLLQSIIDDIDYRAMLMEEYPENQKMVDFKMRSLEFLRDRIARFERHNPDANLRDYLNLMSIAGKENDEEEEQGKVNLMTMHASKGLEFDTVYLAGVEDNIIPSSRALEEDPKAIFEERRLFYVAITRARRELTISYCEKRKDRMGDEHLCIPSRFLEEIPNTLFSEENENLPGSTVEDKIGMLDELLAKFNS